MITPKYTVGVKTSVHTRSNILGSNFINYSVSIK